MAGALGEPQTTGTSVGGTQVGRCASGAPGLWQPGSEVTGLGPNVAVSAVNAMGSFPWEPLVCSLRTIRNGAGDFKARNT